MLTRARACKVHSGNWWTVLPVMEALLATIPAHLSADAIARIAAGHPPIEALDEADRTLALSLLTPRDHLRLITTSAANGQHRICAARIAGVSRVPVWYSQYV
jgi:hypothetical protein